MNDQAINDYISTTNSLLDAQGKAIDILIRQSENNQKLLEHLDNGITALNNLPVIRIQALQKIDNERLNYEMELPLSSIKERSAERRDVSHSITVSLTSFPRRMHELKYTLFSLARQTLQPDRIVLWLSHEEFPQHEDDIALSLLTLIRRWKIDIRWVSNLRSYKKIIPALQEYPDDIIVTADDDIYYHEEWLAELYEEYLQHGNIVAHRVQRVLFDGDGSLQPSNAWPYAEDGSLSYLNIATGVGGVLYFPGCFHSDVTDVEKFLRLCPTADDLWLWAMEILAGQMIRKTAAPRRELVCVNPLREFSPDPKEHLMAENMFYGGNDRQLHQLMREYPRLMTILSEHDGKDQK